MPVKSQPGDATVAVHPVCCPRPARLVVASAGEDELLLLARLDRLMQFGAADPVQSLVQLAGPTDTQDRFRTLVRCNAC